MGQHTAFGSYTPPLSQDRRMQDAGRVKHSFAADHGRRKASDEIFDMLKKFAADRELNLLELSGYILHRASYPNKMDTAAVGAAIYRGEAVNTVKTLSLDEALWLKHLGGGLGKQQWRQDFFLKLL